MNSSSTHMGSVDIINVAGLLMDESPDDLEDALRTLEPRSIRTFAPTPRSAAREHPRFAIERLTEMIQKAVREIQQEFGDPNIVVTARSYAGLIALRALISMNFKYVLRLVSIESPLHPDVVVNPPFLFRSFINCDVHYDARSDLAREAVHSLRSIGTSRLVLVQGCAEDAIVPNAAQVLPGDFDTVEFSHGNLPEIVRLNRLRGLIVHLPENLLGHAHGIKGLLPAGYLNHLCWTEEKMRIIRSIVGSAAGGTLDL